LALKKTPRKAESGTFAKAILPRPLRSLVAPANACLSVIFQDEDNELKVTINVRLSGKKLRTKELAANTTKYAP
jgi:hypothetical protein